MPLYKSGCRAADRTEMKKMNLQGSSPQQIADKTRVNLDMVKEVISGAWNDKETEAAKRQQKLNEVRITGRHKAEQDKIATIAAAAAHAVKASMETSTDEAVLRAEIEAKVRAEIAAETKPKRTRRSSEQVKKDNAEKALSEQFKADEAAA
jgi:hypothetical protein